MLSYFEIDDYGLLKLFGLTELGQIDKK